MLPRRQPRRHVAVVQHHAVVLTTFHHARHAQAQPVVGQFVFQHQTQPQTAQLQQGGFQPHRAGVFHLGLVHQIARQGVLFAFVDHVGCTGTCTRNRQHDARVACLRRHLQRGGRGGGVRKVERRAVGHDARGFSQHQLADRQSISVQGQMGKSPEEPLRRRALPRRRVQHMPLKLLEMLGPQEHTLRPNHFVSAHHAQVLLFSFDFLLLEGPPRTAAVHFFQAGARHRDFHRLLIRRKLPDFVDIRVLRFG
ncbi:hypothetical protein D3C71_1355310 [compost metagenome]